MRREETFRAKWPIIDVDMTRAELVNDALEDLPDLAKEVGAVLTGHPVWELSPPDADGVSWLVCRVPAWRAHTHRSHLIAANQAAAAGGSLTTYRQCAKCDRVAGKTGLCTTHRGQVKEEQRRLKRVEVTA